MKFLIVLSLLFLMGCAQRIKVPINRFHSPETIGKGTEVEYRETGVSSGVLDFAGNSTQNSLIMAKGSITEFYLGLGIAERADIFVRVPKESSSLVGIKVQLLGSASKASEVGHKMSFLMGMGSERDEFDQTLTISLKSQVTDFSLVHGYRLSPHMMIYDGFSISDYHFEGAVQGATGLSSNEIDYQAKNIMGAHLGIMLGGANIKVKLEFAAQKIVWTHTDEKIYQHFGLALAAGW